MECRLRKSVPMRAEHGDRRRFLTAGVAAAAAALLGGRLGAQAPDSARTPGGGAAGALGDPSIAGRSRAPTSDADNDAAIQAVEKRIRCTCGCTLDIYTCRTTDFSCTYSPELHREVVALRDEGRSADEIVEEFVARYGEQARMAPEAEGFNLAGYLVPGVLVTGIGATLFWVLSRRRSAVAADEHVAVPVDATQAELAELERALAEDER